MTGVIKLLLISCLLAVAWLTATPKVGDTAPQFSLIASNGSTVALKDYEGKSKVVLVFYRGYW